MNYTKFYNKDKQQHNIVLLLQSQRNGNSKK